MGGTLIAERASPQRRGHEPAGKPRPLWLRPRWRSLVILVVLGGLAGLARIFAGLRIDLLWFDELGQERVFWTMLGSRWLAAGLAGLGTAIFLLGNFWIVERVAPRDARLRRGDPLRFALVPMYLAAAGAAGVLVGRSVAIADWQQLLLWLHRRDFGVTDPLFDRDVGFFVFSLPFYLRVSEWLLVTLALALVGAVIGHLATGGIRARSAAISATRGAQAHLLLLGALLLLVVAWRHWLGQFELELPRPGDDVAGAGYTDVHVHLPWLRVLAIVALGGALLLVYAALRRSWSLPALVLVIVATAELLNPSVLPSAVQRFIVDPQTLARERPFLADSIKYTRLAYGLDRVRERGLSATATISRRELRANRDVLSNIQLWDADVLKDEVDQQRSIGSYYSFRNVSVDRYRLDGKPRAAIVAAREADVARLEPSGRGWANDHLSYTHGYGLAAVPSGGVDREGKPTFYRSDSGAAGAPVSVRQPRIYYGVQPPGSMPWVIARTHRHEVENPMSGAVSEPDYHYDGEGGIPLSSWWSRGLFALRLGEPNFVLSETLGNNSRVILHRDVSDRLRHLAPFLRWEDRPEVAAVDGRVVFIAHGYTTSNSFPYSEHVDLDGTRLNYMRAAVVGVVDAFSGKVEIYATAVRDPLLSAWRAAFPTLFTPASAMSPELRAHLRYPPELFEIQARVWANYHMGNAADFYTREDAWQLPADVSGPVQKVGTLTSRERNESPRMEPAFSLARRPGEDRLRFMLATPFTPHGQENLSAYLSGTVNTSGLPSLVQFSFPQSRLPLGPSQISRQILATPSVADRLRLLNQETTDLGDQAVNTVGLGATRVVPIADSFLYVQPIYVTAQGTGVTSLRLVAVYLNGRIGHGPTLRAALRQALAAKT